MIDLKELNIKNNVKKHDYLLKSHHEVLCLAVLYFISSILQSECVNFP